MNKNIEKYKCMCRCRIRRNLKLSAARYIMYMYKCILGLRIGAKLELRCQNIGTCH